MKRLLHIFFICVVLISFFDLSVDAESEFEMNLNNFYQKQERASKILKEIETDLKDGSRDRACARQKEAAKYGIEATESLIKAIRIDGSKTEIENVQAALEKWRALNDSCY